MLLHQAPSKVAFCTTMNYLWKRNISIVKWICMCKRREESINHLLLHCDYPYNPLPLALCLFGLLQVMPKRVIDVLAWEQFHYALCGLFGKNAIQCTFEGFEHSSLEISLLFLCCTYDWMDALSGHYVSCLEYFQVYVSLFVVFLVHFLCTRGSFPFLFFNKIFNYLL